MVIRANGAIEKVFSIDAGKNLFGSMLLRHFDANTGMHLEQEEVGVFYIHAAHQVHEYNLSNDVAVCETIFVLSTAGTNGKLDPPGVYQQVELTNHSQDEVDIFTYAFVALRGETPQDVQAEYDADLGALIAWNESDPTLARVVGSSEKPVSFETTLDYAQAVSGRCPGTLSGKLDATEDPLGVLQHRHHLDPGEKATLSYLLSFGHGRKNAIANYQACPSFDDAFEGTQKYYACMLGRSVVMTPDPFVNRGVLWAKANILRVETKAPTGWSFTNDPTRSNNSVSRDTAWFGMGADYFTPEFVRDSLLAYVKYQEANGKIIEYYDIRTGQTEDYGLNINDDTPLLIIALWHHYNTSGNRDFLEQVYPAAAKAARYILSQRNKQGLVWATATGVSDWGIAGWRNVIPNYRLAGATTEVNSESYAALDTVSQMARELGKHEDSEEFAAHAEQLKTAINTHLLNSSNDLYYLNINLRGQARSDVTSDLVFPVIFKVAPERVAAHIVGRLSYADFWTTAGMRTSPRDSPDYTPNGAWGLMGGVWVGVSFWYAFAAAPYTPEFMAYALSTTFRNYSSDPLANNTVPGQFSEWLNGETLVNMGMMLSPWFPPRYLWAAIEGAAGLNLAGGTVSIEPRLSPEWKWLGVQNLPYRDQSLTWLAVRAPDLRLYTNFSFPGQATTMPYRSYQADITQSVHAPGDSICAMGLCQGQDLLLFAGNTADHTVTSAMRVARPLAGAYHLRSYDSLLGQWIDHPDLLPAERISRGLTVNIERGGFWLLELRQEV